MDDLLTEASDLKEDLEEIIEEICDFEDTNTYYDNLHAILSAVDKRLKIVEKIFEHEHTQSVGLMSVASLRERLSELIIVKDRMREALIPLLVADDPRNIEPLGSYFCSPYMVDQVWALEQKYPADGGFNQLEQDDVRITTDVIDSICRRMDLNALGRYICSDNPVSNTTISAMLANDRHNVIVNEKTKGGYSAVDFFLLKYNIVNYRTYWAGQQVSIWDLIHIGIEAVHLETWFHLNPGLRLGISDVIAINAYEGVPLDIVHAVIRRVRILRPINHG